MKEKEKMLLGKMYLADKDDELIKERNTCKKLCTMYNNCQYDNFEYRKNLLKQILGKTKQNYTIEPNFWCDYGYNIEIGENFYSNHNLVILDPAKVTFGNNVYIGPNCGFYTAEHPIDKLTRNSGLEYAKPIYVGNDVWIGGNVSVLPGVKIGNNVVIAAGSVVTKDIPDNSLAAGVPAKTVKSI